MSEIKETPSVEKKQSSLRGLRKVESFYLDPEKFPLVRLVETGDLHLSEDQKEWVRNLGQELIEIKDRCQKNSTWWPESEIPESAQEIVIHNKKDGRISAVSEFDESFKKFVNFTLLRETDELIGEIQEASRVGIELPGEDSIISQKITRMREISESVVQAKKDYVEYHDIAVPELRSAVTKLNKRARRETLLNKYKGEYILGNGADPIYWALRASRWKTRLQDVTHPVQIDIGRPFLTKGFAGKGYYHEINPEYQEGLRENLEKAGIQPDGRWIDTAIRGSIAKALIKLLDPAEEKVPHDDASMNKYISLLSTLNAKFPFPVNLMFKHPGYDTSSEGIEVIGQEKVHRGGLSYSMPMHLIDDSPRAVSQAKKPEDLFVAQGNVYTRMRDITPARIIRAHAIRQAVIREFLPKATTVDKIVSRARILIS